MAKKTAKLFIIGDPALLREGLARAFDTAKGLSVCGTSPSGAEAVRGIARTKPDVVLELTGNVELRKQHPGLPVVAVAELPAGAGPAKAADVLRQAAAGRPVGPTSSRLLRAAPAEPESGGVGTLSGREMEVFRLLGQGVSTRRIAERLGRSIKTIETHREAIKRKLGLDDAVQLVQRAAAWAARSGQL